MAFRPGPSTNFIYFHEKSESKAVLIGAQEQSLSKSEFFQNFSLFLRLVLAARDIKAGELILEEQPLARLPPFYTRPVCLGCYTLIDPKNYVKCPGCNFPMCCEECCDSADHLLECKMMKKTKFKLDTKKLKFDEDEPIYDAITPLRILALKSKNLEKFNEYMDLMDHMEDYKKIEGWLDAHKPTIGKTQCGKTKHSLTQKIS